MSIPVAHTDRLGTTTSACCIHITTGAGSTETKKPYVSRVKVEGAHGIRPVPPIQLSVPDCIINETCPICPHKADCLAVHEFIQEVAGAGSTGPVSPARPRTAPEGSKGRAADFAYLIQCNKQLTGHFNRQECVYGS